MAFKNVHQFWKMLEAITSGVAHFSMTYLDFEIIQTYLNWSYLNAIYILDAPEMLEVVMGHWNNSDSTPNYFQDFIKWFSILLNQNKTN